VDDPGYRSGTLYDLTLLYASEKTLKNLFCFSRERVRKISARKFYRFTANKGIRECQK